MATPPDRIADACFLLMRQCTKQSGRSPPHGSDDGELVRAAALQVREALLEWPVLEPQWLEFILLPLFQAFPATTPATLVLERSRVFEVILNVLAMVVRASPSSFSSRPDLFTPTLLRGLLTLTGTDGRLAKTLEAPLLTAALGLLEALCAEGVFPENSTAPQSLGHWASLLVDLLQTPSRDRDVYLHSLQAFKALLGAVDLDFKRDIIPGASLALFRACSVDYKLGSRIPQLSYEAMGALVVALLSQESQDERLSVLLSKMLKLEFDAPNVCLARLSLAGDFLLKCQPRVTNELQTACLDVVTAEVAHPYPSVKECALGILAQFRADHRSEWTAIICPLLRDLFQANLQRATLVDLNESELLRAIASCASICDLLGSGASLLVDVDAGKLLSQFVLVLQISHSWDKRPRVVVLSEEQFNLSFARFGLRETLEQIHSCIRSLCRSVPWSAGLFADLLLQVLDPEGEVDSEALATIGPEDGPQCLLIIGQLALGCPEQADDLLSSLLRLPIWGAPREAGVKNPRASALEASQRQCALIALGDIAQALKQRFRLRLVDALFPAIQCLGDVHAGVSACAQIALQRMARCCGQTSAKALIESNMDYVVDELIHRLRRWDDATGVSDIASLLRVLLSHVDTWGVDSAHSRAVAQAVMGGLDEVTISPEQAWAFIRALRALVENLPALSLNVGSEGVVDEFDQVSSLLREYQAFTSLPDDDVAKETSDDEALDPSVNEPPESFALTADILARAQHYFGHPDMAVRRQATLLAADCLYKMGKYAKRHIHALWPTLLLNMKRERHPLGMESLLRLVLACVDVSGDFMSNRIQDELWPALRPLVSGSRSRVGARIDDSVVALAFDCLAHCAALLGPIVEDIILATQAVHSVKRDSLWTALEHVPEGGDVLWLRRALGQGQACEWAARAQRWRHAVLPWSPIV